MEKKSPASDSRTTRYTPATDPRLTLRPQLFQIAPYHQADDEQFERKFLEELIDQDPCNEEALMVLGHAYTRMGEYEKGLAIDRRLVRLRPADPTAFYNLACSCSLMSQVDDAFVALERAVSLGYRDLTHMQKDPDLTNLRQDPRFRRLMGRLHSKGGSSNS